MQFIAKIRDIWSLQRPRLRTHPTILSAKFEITWIKKIDELTQISEISCPRLMGGTGCMDGWIVMLFFGHM